LPEFQAAALYQLAECERRLGRTEAAVAAYANVLAARPDHGPSRIALALLHGAAGRRLDAIRVMDDWVREFPEPVNYRTAAETMDRLGYRDAAAFYAREAEARADK